MLLSWRGLNALQEHIKGVWEERVFPLKKVYLKGPVTVKKKKDTAYFVESTTLRSQANSPFQGYLQSFILICWICPTTHKSKHRPWSERFSVLSASQSRYLRHVHSADVACHKVRGPLAGDQVSTHIALICTTLAATSTVARAHTHTHTFVFRHKDISLFQHCSSGAFLYSTAAAVHSGSLPLDSPKL